VEHLGCPGERPVFGQCQCATQESQFESHVDRL
jgi:hypothetical protein